MYDALVLSDIHLGSDNCEAKELSALLELIHSGELPTERIILNGDVFDSFDFRRLSKNHWRVLSLLRKMSDWIEIIWIHGNHDGPAEIFSHLLGVTVRDDLILESGGKRILIHHGHRFDQFIDRHPLLTACADLAYRWLQRIDTSHYFARTAKRRSKIFCDAANGSPACRWNWRRNSGARRYAAATRIMRWHSWMGRSSISTAVVGLKSPATICRSRRGGLSCIRSLLSWTPMSGRRRQSPAPGRPETWRMRASRKDWSLLSKVSIQSAPSHW